MHLDQDIDRLGIECVNHLLISITYGVFKGRVSKVFQIEKPGVAIVVIEARKRKV